MAARRHRLIGLVALAALACVQNDGRRFNPLRAVIEVSEADERSVGHEFDREIEHHMQVIDDPIVTRFVHDLGQYLLHWLEPQPFVYRFRVVNAASLNAFAVPGGYIYLHSGTVLSAGSVEELAGVLAHEIAHVKGHHYARLREKSLVPDLLAGLGGLAVAVASGQPGALLTAQGANVALKLRFTREVEAEADELGVVFLARAGYDPDGMARFFDRIAIEQERHPMRLPPYLYSHPDVEIRRQAVRDRAERLRLARAPPPEFEERFRAVQSRLAEMVGRRLDRLPTPARPFDREANDVLLLRAEELAEDDRSEALAVLAEAELREPRDPRPPLRVARLLEEERPEVALAAYERTLALDPTNTLALLRAGLVARRLGRRAEAAYLLDQARRHSREGSEFRKRVEWEDDKLTFPVVVEAVLTDERGGPSGDAAFAQPRRRFGRTDARVVWWGRIGERHMDDRDEIRVRFIDPRGKLAHEESVEERTRPHVRAHLELDGREAGVWIAEAVLEDEVVDRRRFELR